MANSWLMVILVGAVNCGLCLYWWLLIKKAKEERSVLVRQNLVYLIAFVNYFEWLDKNYTASVVATLFSDDSYIEYMKKNGLPEKLFSGIVEGAIEKSNISLKLKTQEVLEAIKQPLAPEINALLEDE